MTTPTQPAPTQPVTVHPVAVPSTVRALISICETVAFIAAATLGTMNNGQDFRHAVVITLYGLIAHGVNHNAGGSPV